MNLRKLGGCLASVAVLLVTQYALGQVEPQRQTNVVDSLVAWTGDYTVGSNSSANVLLVKTGGRLSNEKGFVGYLQGDSGNGAHVTGKDATWLNRGALVVGYRGDGNWFVVSNRGTVVSALATEAGSVGEGWDAGWIGFWSDNNQATVTGVGSAWRSRNICVGEWGKNNILTISDGAEVSNGDAWIGRDPGAENNRVLVTGTGTVWNNSGSLSVGTHGFGCRLDIRDGAKVFASTVVVGETFPPMSGNGHPAASVIEVDGGSLVVTNTQGNARLTLGQSTAQLVVKDGNVVADQIVVYPSELASYPQHGPNRITLSGGNLQSKSTTVAKGRFVVGNGQTTATFRMNGGSHVFADGLGVASNSTLTGTGTLTANLILDGAVVLEKGESVFNGDVTNNGRVEAGADTKVVFAGQVVNNGTIIAPKGKVRFAKGVKGAGSVVDSKGQAW